MVTLLLGHPVHYFRANPPIKSTLWQKVHRGCRYPVGDLMDYFHRFHCIDLWFNYGPNNKYVSETLGPSVFQMFASGNREATQSNCDNSNHK